MHCVFITLMFHNFISAVISEGLLLLYRPRDISSECAFSHRLRYDISFAMGMSDTTTLVLRTLNEIDYECTVEIVTESKTYIVFVIKYPTNIGLNCAANKDAFTVMKKNKCIRLCDIIVDRELSSFYYIGIVVSRIRFRFLSNSSINSDIHANFYQVTATSARKQPLKGCNPMNESVCNVAGDDYCFTSGVVCDGINNCGVTDWFDERKSDCGLPIERLGFTPVIAMVAAMLCALLAAGHILLRCLPPLANSFFIFNANEDNRLCIDSIFKSRRTRSISIDKAKRLSLIPVSLTSSSTSSSRDNEESQVIAETLRSISISGDPSKSADESNPSKVEDLTIPLRMSTMRYMAEKIQKKFRREKKPLKSIIDFEKY